MFKNLCAIIMIVSFMCTMLGITAHSCVVRGNTQQTKALIAEYIIYDLVKLAPGRKLYKNRKARMVLATEIVQATEDTKVPVGILTILAYKEASFRTDIQGKGGEKGITQVLPGGALDMDCDLETRFGQLKCGAKGLQLCYKNCKNWYGALMQYKTGHCESKSMDIQRKILHRLNVYNKYQRKIRGGAAQIWR